MRLILLVSLLLLLCAPFASAFPSLPLIDADHLPAIKNFYVVGPYETLGKRLGGEKQNYWISCKSHSMWPTMDCFQRYIFVKAQEYNQGDIIWFRNPSSDITDPRFVFHRIIGVTTNGSYITRGDANKVDDQTAFGWKPISKKDVLFKAMGQYYF